MSRNKDGYLGCNFMIFTCCLRSREAVYRESISQEITEQGVGQDTTSKKPVSQEITDQEVDQEITHQKHMYRKTAGRRPPGIKTHLKDHLFTEDDFDIENIYSLSPFVSYSDIDSSDDEFNIDLSQYNYDPTSYFSRGTTPTGDPYDKSIATTTVTTTTRADDYLTEEEERQIEESLEALEPVRRQEAWEAAIKEDAEAEQILEASLHGEPGLT